MNDMAFGGGSEMLRDGDLTGHWALVESGMKYQCPLTSVYHSAAERFRRIFNLVGHLPWLARFIILIPGSTNDLDNMRKACFEQALARKKKGTKQKDLFYYLVGTAFLFLYRSRFRPGGATFTVRRAWCRERRNTLRYRHQRQ